MNKMNPIKIKSSREFLFRFYQCFEKFGELDSSKSITADYCYKEIFNVYNAPNTVERNQFIAEYRNLSREITKKNLLDIVLPSKSCAICGSNLILDDNPKEIIIYGNNKGTVVGKRFSSHCRPCGVTDFLTFYSHKGKRYLTKDKSDIFVSTEETAFRREFLETFEWELLLGCMPFRQKCAIYNCIHGYMFEKCADVPNKRAR